MHPSTGPPEEATCLARPATGGTPFVLVHGGGHGAWCWEAVLPALPAGSIAVDLPGRGRRSDWRPPVRLEDFAKAIVDDVESAGLGDVVVVYHSMGGLSAPLVAQRLGKRVRHTVYVSAIIPLPGETMLEAAYGSRLFTVLNRIAALGRDRLAGPRWLARRALCSDLPRSRHHEVLDRVCPEWVSVTVESATITARDVPTRATYVKLLQDRLLFPRRQDAMASRLGPECTIVTIDAGHDVMISRPAELATALLAAGRSPPV